MTTLVTGPLRLEPQVAAHAREMFEVLSDPAIYEFENSPPPSLDWLEDRFRRLEVRHSQDGSEEWFNWAIRLPDGALAGYVQATLRQSGAALVAYELSSTYWRQGIGSAAVRRVLEELKSRHQAHTFVAVLKTVNYRSFSLLTKLGFELGSVQDRAEYCADSGESVMVRRAERELRSCSPCATL